MTPKITFRLFTICLVACLLPSAIAQPISSLADSFNNEQANAATNTQIYAYRTDQTNSNNDDRVQYILSQNVVRAGACCEGGGCSSCGGKRGCDSGGVCRIGEGCPHPWKTGRGYCDDFAVGPHWDISIDGVVLFREDVSTAELQNILGVPITRIEQFGYEAGARAYASAWDINGVPPGFGIQLGYVGVDSWAAYGQGDAGAGTVQLYDYSSGIHSGEFNFLQDIGRSWTPYCGVRYIQLGEDFSLREVTPDIHNIANVKNKMIGFQVGVQGELFSFGDYFHIEGFVNGGVYQNTIKRYDHSGTISGGTTLASATEDNDIAFLGEASLTSVYSISDCVSLRGGYQFLYVDGIMRAQEAIIGAGFNTTHLYYHGFHVGVEYKR